MSEREPAIVARGLWKSFGHRPVLCHANLELAAGRCAGLTGANGTGKTTLLRCLAGLVRPAAGEVRWFGRPATSDPRQRRWIGMVAHESRIYPHLTLRENLVFSARMCRVAEPALRASQWLEQIGLAPHADRRPTQISRGMQQRVAVARAMIHDPPIILLDEPFSGLDAEGSRWLIELLRSRRDQGQTICFSSHDPATTRQLADEVFELRAGRLHSVTRQHEVGSGSTACLRAA